MGDPLTQRGAAPRERLADNPSNWITSEWPTIGTEPLSDTSTSRFLDSFRFADDAGVNAGWLESKMPSAAPSA